MSEDWLVTSPRAVRTPDLLLALAARARGLTLRADTSGESTLVLDATDRPALWVCPSRRAADPVDATSRAGIPAQQGEMAWWTEVVQPAGPRAATGLLDPARAAPAIAAVVAGSARCLSLAPGPRRGQGGARSIGTGGGTETVGHGPEPHGDVPCDVLRGTSAIFLQTRRVVALSAWVAGGIGWAQDRALTPVLLTPESTQLSPVLHHVAERGGCHWIRHGSGEAHDGITGSPVAWDGSHFSPARGPSWEMAGSGTWDVVLECETLHPEGHGLRVGPFAESIHHACGLAPATSWGALEPTDRAWDTWALTERARSTSPAPSRYLTRSVTGDGIGTVVPHPVGVAERYVLHAPAEGLMPSDTDLGRLGERLLRTGSDLAILGYRRSTLTPGGPLGRAGRLLPGVICLRPSRYAGLDPQSLAPAPYVRSRTYGVGGVILTFQTPRRPGDQTSAALLTAWGHALRTLAEHDVLGPATHATAAPSKRGDRHGRDV